MAITRRTDYAVRLMYELAQLPTGATLSVRDLCAAADVPDNFGTSIMTYLCGANLARCEGYNSHLMSLALPAEQITMAQIVRASEPEFSLAQCTHEPESCSRSGHCGAHLMWLELDALVWQRLESITLAQVAANHGGTHKTPRVPSSFTGLLGIA